MVDLVPMVAPSQVEVSIELRALEHKSKRATVKTFRPKLRKKRRTSEEEELNHLRQRISLPEHFASCEMNIVVNSTAAEEEAKMKKKSLTYTVKLHVGEY